MSLGSFIPFATYALPAITGVLLIVLVIEVGARWAWMAYFAVSVLAFLLASDKEPVLLFVLFFGYYPILKSLVEKRFRKKPVELLIKFAVFNVAMVLCFYLALQFLGMSAEEFTIFGVSMPWLFLLVGNVVFFIYDYGLTGLVSMYVYRFHKTVQKMMRLK